MLPMGHQHFNLSYLSSSTHHVPAILFGIGTVWYVPVDLIDFVGSFPGCQLSRQSTVAHLQAAVTETQREGYQG